MFVWCQISSGVLIFDLMITVLFTGDYFIGNPRVPAWDLVNLALAKHDLTSFPWCRWMQIDGKTVRILGHLSIGQCLESFFFKESEFIWMMQLQLLLTIVDTLQHELCIDDVFYLFMEAETMSTLEWLIRLTPNWK